MLSPESCTSAAWPELERDTETLAHLADLYCSLEQELAALQHIKVDTITVINHLGREMPVPLIFCQSWPVRRSDFRGELPEH